MREVPALGCWIKDDGPIGGNKVRKLEHTLADAVRRGRRTVLTFGGIGSNHAVATAEACRPLGLRCVLALVDQPVDPHVSANLARMRAAGAVVVRTRTKALTMAAAPWLLARYRPYVLPLGGSSELGVRGFVDAAAELAGQVARGELPAPSTVVVAVGSGGTAAGLARGLPAAGLRPRVVGVLVNDRTRVDVARMAGEGALPVEVVRSFLGPGYGHPTPAGVAAASVARGAGVPVEPVYTAKALAAIRALDLEPPVLYWQTFDARGPVPPPGGGTGAVAQRR